ncbi:MAG TPA: Nudix family hydrolase [Burkholderiales bacterium]|nr:Nudix family hydrolase [Burkholderiales bacterium]
MIEVAAAVIQRPDGRFLLAQRPTGKVYAGYWEFPGGKIEPGERAERALARELHEEIGIDVRAAYPWITREYVYPHGHVRLNFFRVLEWSGDPHPREEQAIAWQAISGPLVSPMLPANAPVLASLALPQEYAVTDAMRLGTAEMLARLERRLEGGLRLVQIREPSLSQHDRELFTVEAIGLAHRYGGKVLVKTPHANADGVHYTAAELMRLELRPDRGLAAASCHTRQELERAMQLGLDFAVVGPVLEKGQAAPLGWARFAEIVRGASIPIYAIGGLRPADMRDAWRAGAHGLAMIRGSWS